VVVLAGFGAAFYFMKPAPPSRLVIAAGRTDGAYYQFGLRYRELLARERITLDVRPTSGSVENIRLLQDPNSGVDIAFVQGGTGGEAPSGDLVSLGSLYFEPLWVFSRPGMQRYRLNGLRGRRLAVGPQGSGTRALVTLLLKANGITADTAVFLPITGLEAVRALRDGTVDVVFLVASPQSSTIREALRLPGVAPRSFGRADAYARLYPFLTKLVLPEGALNLETNVPSRETVLVAPAANLVARGDLHPALVSLLLVTASKVHGGAGMFERALQFPSPDYLEFPLNDDARRYYQSGPPFLARYLPFWAATLVDRLKIMLLPLFALVLPLLGIIPPTYEWRMRRKIYLWYRHVRAVDLALAGYPSGATLAGLREGLDRIEGEVRRVAVPLRFMDAQYHLLLHIDFVRKALAGAENEARGERAGRVEQGPRGC
jgi:TRAP-type uncharacterized transport system substrate-binding protein